MRFFVKIWQNLALKSAAVVALMIALDEEQMHLIFLTPLIDGTFTIPVVGKPF